MNRSSLVDFVALVAAVASVACSSSSGSSSATPAGGTGQTVGAQTTAVGLLSITAARNAWSYRSMDCGTTNETSPRSTSSRRARSVTLSDTRVSWT